MQVKQTLDPTNVMNPGIKISEASFTEHIDYQRLSKSCATCAKCNSVCPVYDVFQSEDMSSRGWFEIVTSKDYSYLNSQAGGGSLLELQILPDDLSGRGGRFRIDPPAARRASQSRFTVDFQPASETSTYLKRFLKCWRTRSLSGTVPCPGPCSNAWPRR